MMKSMFLSDSKVLDMDNNTSNNNTHSKDDSCSSQDNEYIIVDCTPSLDYDTDMEHDEDDYDYCDDAISEGMQPCSFMFNLTEDMILEEAEQPSIQYILDDAHKSASQLVSITEQQDLPKPGTGNSSGTSDNNNNNQVPGILESSASDVSVQSAAEVTKQEPPQTETATATPTDHAGTDSSKSLLQSQPNPQRGGRMSNKKRRKKMKLLKKAAAAAKAAAALSSDVPSTIGTTKTSTSSSSSKSLKKTLKIATPVTRYQNRRVANIAVACATETLASYKAELSAVASKKVH